VLFSVSTRSPHDPVLSQLYSVHTFTCNCVKPWGWHKNKSPCFHFLKRLIYRV